MSGEENAERGEIPGVTFVVSLDAFRRHAVKGAITTTDVVDSHDIYTRIHEARAAAKAAGDTDSLPALEVLGQISAYHFAPDDRIEPFRPMAIMDGRRSLIPTDLLSDQIVILAELVPNINHHSFRARVADVCWLLNKKDAASGLRAVASYVECVTRVLNGEARFDFDERNPASVPAVEYLKRAIIIARSMGWKRSEFDSLRQVIADVSQHALNADDGWGFIHIGPINLGNRVWELVQTAQAAEILAASVKLSGDHPARRSLWELAGRAYLDAKDADNSNRCLIEAAETYVGDADARPDSAAVQVHFLNDAIQALRPIPGTANRRRDLQGRLNSIQPRIMDEMSSFSHATNIADLIEAVDTEVRGKPFAQVIRTLLMCETSPDPDKLREEVLNARHGSLAALFSTTVSDSQGRTRFVAPGLGLSGPPDENQVRFLINQNDRVRRSLVVSGKINPIRRVLWEEHSVFVDALLPLMRASPFVPPHHEYSFAIGAAKFIGGPNSKPRI